MAIDRLPVSILLSDPWDLGESIAWQPVLGTLVTLSVDAHGGRALIRFKSPLSYRGTSYPFAVAVPRHAGDSLDAIHRDGTVACSFVAVSDEQAASDAALATEHWRGGLAFIGELAAA